MTINNKDVFALASKMHREAFEAGEIANSNQPSETWSMFIFKALRQLETKDGDARISKAVTSTSTQAELTKADQAHHDRARNLHKRADRCGF